MCGTPGEDEDVAEADARRARHPVLDQLRAFGHARHPQPRLGEPAAARVIGFERSARALGWTTTATPSAAAIASTVMSSWVGPMPPVVNR